MFETHMHIIKYTFLFSIVQSPKAQQLRLVKIHKLIIIVEASKANVKNVFD